MFDKIRAGYAVLQAGKSVADPALWKKRQITTTALTAVIWAAVQAAAAFGINVPVDTETVDGLAVAVIAVVNFVLTIATTKKAVL